MIESNRKTVHKVYFQYGIFCRAACHHGYHGRNCEEKCPFPYYGFKCLSKCHCGDKDCHNVYGCRHSSIGKSLMILFIFDLVIGCINYPNLRLLVFIIITIIDWLSQTDKNEINIFKIFLFHFMLDLYTIW